MWITLRKANSFEIETLEKRAKNFIARHKIPNCNSVNDLEIYLVDKYELNRLWRRSVKRVLGKQADGIIRGEVGYNGDI